jgi:hypothetical protein
VSATHRKSSSDFRSTQVREAPVRRSSRSSIPACAGVLACAVAATACAALNPFRSTVEEPSPRPAAAPEDETQSVREAPDVSLATEDDFVVRVVAGAVSCSGALIAEDRVLTAHHCVAVRGPRGEYERRDVKPESIRVELGGDHLPWGDVGVRSIVAPTCGHTAGDGDIAVLVLERPLHGVTTRPADLDAAPAKGDTVIPIGFGRCDGSSDGIYRKRRPGRPVQRVMEQRFQLEAGICPGDSGGPVVHSVTQKIVGVVSASAMDADETTLGLTELTRLDHYRSIFAAAALISDGASRAELPPIDCKR